MAASANFQTLPQLSNAMKSTFSAKKTWQQRYLRPLVGAALLSTFMLPALAAGTDANTEIDNTAYGSFESPADPGVEIPVESNTVTITIAEVAGIDVTAQTVTEAPVGINDAGPSQGDGIISAGDVVYFTYRITNIGNDQTQFFIPGVPSSVTNGSFDAADNPIEIVAYNDGTTTTPVNNLPIPAAGAASGSSIIGPSLPNGGSVPVDGYIEVRVPVKADSGLVAGADQITVALGNTPSSADQNVPVVAGGEYAEPNSDVITQDNPGTDNGDFDGSPSTEREASDVLVTDLGEPNLDYGDAPDLSPGTASGDYQTAPGLGPSHVVDGVSFLGTVVDAENTAADDGPGEDDGVVLDDGGTPVTLHGETFAPGETFELDVTTNGPGVLNAWIDFNNDGDFDDPGEQVAADAVPDPGGIVTITSTVPFSSVPGDTYARFRYSTDAGLTPEQAASDGEVEDYQITIEGAAPALKLVKRVTRVGATNNTAVIDDPADPDDDAGVNWPADYLQGEIAATAEPNQEIEYTVYFLSDGNTTAANVNLCDLVPENTTYVAGSLLLSQGTAAPTALTDGAGDDAGESFDSSVITPAEPCQGNNTDGGVYVTVPTDLPNATAPGTPEGSYGFIRFTVEVD